MHDATAQVPERHVSFAFGSTQGFLHAPHSASVFKRVSQPSEMSELQSAKPAVQLPIVHAPAAQPALPFATKHALPHPPQFATLVAVSTSHPSAALPLQSASVPPHVEMPHTPPTQFAVPLTSGQTLVQLPQASTLFDVSTSQPFDASVSQSRKLPVHVMEHAPSAHVAVPWFVEHGVPHAPQFLVLVLVSVSQPFESMPSQSANPAAQLSTTHRPPAQAAVACASAHGRAHPPQLSGSASVLTSQPSVGLVLQFADGAMQAPIRQAPFWHVESAFGNVHTLPHAPQFDGSLRVFTSQPVEVSWSQLEKPALQLMISQALWMHC
jgi:hypothetical protein